MEQKEIASIYRELRRVKKTIEAGETELRTAKWKILKMIKSLDKFANTNDYDLDINFEHDLPPTLKELIIEYEVFTNNYYQNGVYRLFDNTRKPEYVYIRDFFYKMAMKHYNITTLALGRMVKRNHTTILFSLKKEVLGDKKYEEIKRKLIENNLYYES